jgi:hypothetical protein
MKPGDTRALGTTLIWEIEVAKASQITACGLFGRQTHQLRLCKQLQLLIVGHNFDTATFSADVLPN